MGAPPSPPLLLLILHVGAFCLGPAHCLLEIAGNGTVVSVLEGSAESVVLDCDYSLGEKPADGLVVKWYFRDDPQPIYQWIPDQTPQGIGAFRERLNLQHVSSEDSREKHRAIEVVGLVKEVTGNYTCRVSTFHDEGTLTTELIVYVPPKALRVSLEKGEEEELVNASCSASGTFPRPEVELATGDVVWKTLLGSSESFVGNSHFGDKIGLTT